MTNVMVVVRCLCSLWFILRHYQTLSYAGCNVQWNKYCCKMNGENIYSVVAVNTGIGTVNDSYPFYIKACVALTNLTF